MPKNKKIRPRKPQETAEGDTAPSSRDAGEKLVDWIQGHRRTVVAGTAAIATVAVLGWFTLEYRRNKEEAASEALAQARFASQSGNFPLAANDLSRVIDQFSGTSAADEAVILLAQVRLLQEQPNLAAEELQAALGNLSQQFQAPAHGLLGTALENTGRMVEAAQAYESAADACWYDGVAAQYLNDAARAWWASGDLDAAIATYERVLEEHPESSSATEARVRLGELRGMARPPATS
jgi:tetratricopeptide (TPR) repeat protein